MKRMLSIALLLAAVLAAGFAEGFADFAGKAAYGVQSEVLSGNEVRGNV